MHTKVIASVIVLSGLAVALPAFAQSTTTSATNPSSAQTKIACVGAAVAAREKSIGADMMTYTAAENDAYGARASALEAAYSLTTTSAVKAAVRSAWSTFRSSMNGARHTWVKSRNSAWSAFRSAAAACKAPSGVSDGANASSEATGN